MTKIKETMTSSPKIQDTDDKLADAPAMPQESAATLAADATQESQLQQEIDKLTEENHRLRDQCVRAVAETDNVRKRSQRDIAEASRYAISNFAKDMAGVLENLKRAS